MDGKNVTQVNNLSNVIELILDHRLFDSKNCALSSILHNFLRFMMTVYPQTPPSKKQNQETPIQLKFRRTL